MRNLKRCPWPSKNDPLYLNDHDQEWGVPLHDDRKIFEFLVLESFQAGLSWRTILHKRQNFRKAFANFNYQKVAAFGPRDFQSLIKNSGIVRNRLKIAAAIHNARCFLQLRKEFRSFANYMWSWVKHKPIRHRFRSLKETPAYTPEALAWAKDLKKRGFKFLGPTVVYSHRQAVGMVNDHLVHCFRDKAQTNSSRPKSRL